MTTAPLVLGLPGDLVDQTENIDHTATKAGGLPFLPARCDAAALPELKCGVCGKLLSLVFQAYAPLGASVNGRPLNDRVIYVFGCIAEGCGVQPGCWRALRLQEAARDGADAMPNQAETTPDNAASIPPEEPPPPTSDDWGTGAGDWGMGGGAAGGDWGMGGNGWGFSGGDAGAQDDPFSSVAAEPFGFGDLDAALDNLAVSSAAAAAAETGASKSKEAALRGAHGPSGTSQDVSGGANHGTGRSGGRNLASGCCGAELPEFHIYAGEEHREDRHLGAVPKEHAERLLAQYQEDGEQMPEAAIIEAAAEGGGGGECANSQQLQPETWAGEEYEEDHTAAVDAAGMKFLQRLQRSPEQCARYSFGGAVLWPAVSRPAPEPCGACGGPRAFELQLMGPLVHFLEEAGEWLREGPQGSQVAAPPPSWCWATVAVYSCAGSCVDASSSPGSPYDVAEEWVAVIND